MLKAAATRTMKCIKVLSRNRRGCPSLFAVAQIVFALFSANTSLVFITIRLDGQRNRRKWMKTWNTWRSIMSTIRMETVKALKLPPGSWWNWAISLRLIVQPRLQLPPMTPPLHIHKLLVDGETMRLNERRLQMSNARRGNRIIQFV